MHPGSTAAKKHANDSPDGQQALQNPRLPPQKMDTHQQRRTTSRRSLLGRPQPRQGNARRAQQLAEHLQPNLLAAV